MDCLRCFSAAAIEEGSKNGHEVEDNPGVDDDRDTCWLLSQMLGSYGYGLRPSLTEIG